MKNLLSTIYEFIFQHADMARAGTRTVHAASCRQPTSSNNKSQIVNGKYERAFTLVEVLVAVAILAIALGAMGVIFRMSLDAYRASSATAEIMRKLRAITEQLNTDFKGLRKDGMIVFVWNVSEDQFYDLDYPDDTTQLAHRYHREDIMLFFANGDFQTYDEQETTTAGVKKPIRGNVARIEYIIARDKDNFWPDWFGLAGIGQPGQQTQRDQRRRTRILARSQHIITSDPVFPLFPDFDTISGLATFDEALYQETNNKLEYDTDGLQGWVNAPVEPAATYGFNAMLSTCTGKGYGSPSNGLYDGGIRVDEEKPEDVHLILCEGVRDLQIQIWDDSILRWWPKTGYIDPVTRDVNDTDFPTKIDGGNTVIDTEDGWYYPVSPGDWLPRMLKFTFTLYDSRGFFKEGRTFTHIIYLDEN